MEMISPGSCSAVFLNEEFLDLTSDGGWGVRGEAKQLGNLFQKLDGTQTAADEPKYHLFSGWGLFDSP